MSCCSIIQNKSATFVATDTAVSKEMIKDVFKRIGYMTKSFVIAENSVVYTSGHVDECLLLKDHLKKLKTVDLEEIRLKLLELKSTRVLKEKIGIVIIDSEKAASMFSEDEFRIHEVPVSEKDMDLRVNVVGSKDEDVLKKYILSELSASEAISDEVIVETFVNGYNRISCPQIGGELDIYRIVNNNVGHMKLRLKDYVPIENCFNYSGHFNLGNGLFTVDSGGNLIAKSITLDGKGTIDAKDMTIKNLVVGKNVLMGEDATITWSKISDKPSDLAYTSDIPSLEDIKGITSTTITSTLVSSPTIRGGTIEGALLRSIGSDKNAVEVLDENKHLAGSIKYETNRQINENTSANALYISTEPTFAMKLHSADNMSLSTEAGKKIYMGDTVFMGSAVDKNGNPIGGSSVAVFG